MHACLPLVLLFLGVNATAAVLELPSIFTDHLVLQREMEAPVWGRASPGAEVSVRLGDMPMLITRADEAGNWKVVFKELKTRVVPTTLVVTSAAESITLRDVVVGEVWFAGGQSNMGTQLKDSADGDAEAAQHSDPLLRIHIVSRSPSDKPEFSTKGTTYSFGGPPQWYPATEGRSAKFSATGYYFAKELRAHLGEVPVGILLCVVGGRPIQSHCAVEVLTRTDLGRRQLAAYHEAVKDWDSGRAEADYPAKLMAWESAKQNIRLKPMKPVDPRTDFWQPATANLTNATGLPASAFIATKEDPKGRSEVLTDR